MRVVNSNGALLVLTGAGGGGGTTFSAGVSTGGNTFGNTGTISNQIVFVGINGVSLSQSTVGGGSATITISGITQSSQPAINAFGVSDTGNTAGNTGTSSGITWVLAGSNANTLSQSTAGGGPNTVWIQGPVSATTISAVSAGNVIGTRGSRFALEDHQHAGVFSAGVSNVGNTAGNTTVVPGRMVYAGSGGVTVSQETAANSLNTIHVQGPVSATTISGVQSANSIGTRGTRFALEDHFHQGLAQFQISGNTSNTSNSVVGSLVLAGGNNITLSQVSAAGAATVTISAAAQTNQQMTMFATGNTTQSSTGTTNASSMIFRGSGAASVGITNGSVLIDVAAGAAAITQSIGISTQTAGGATAGTSGYATGDDILYHFVPGSNITMSQSLNGASATLSIYGPAAGGGATRSFFEPYWNVNGGAGFFNATQIPGNGSILVFPVEIEGDLAISKFLASVSLSISSSSNSSHGGTLSIGFGVYSRNVSTLSLISSALGTYAWTNTSNNSTASLSGIREASGTFGGALALTRGDYWVGLWSRTSTVNANWFTASNIFVMTSGTNSTHSGAFMAAAGAASFQPGIPGQGTYSTTSAALPASMAFSHITGTARWWVRPRFNFLNFNP